MKYFELGHMVRTEKPWNSLGPKRIDPISSDITWGILGVSPAQDASGVCEGFNFGDPLGHKNEQILMANWHRGARGIPPTHH